METRFREIWDRIAPYDAVPQLRIPDSDPRDFSAAEASLDAYMLDEVVWIHAPDRNPKGVFGIRDKAKSIFAILGECREFVVIRQDGRGYWAITEEEYEWLVFTGED